MMQVLIQRIGRLFGLEIRRNGPSARDDLRLAHFLRQQSVDLILDVGANRGQFAKSMFAAGVPAHIVSFEAMPDAHAILLDEANHFPGRWQVAPPMAISDSSGHCDFHVNSADATSSLLPASADTLASIPGTRTSEIITVTTETLDVAAAPYLVSDARTFLKIDVQGGEEKLLAGASATLEKVCGLVVELSLTELYEGQALAFDLLPSLMQRGFEVHDIVPSYRSPETFRTHQIDVVMFHADRLAINR